MREFNCKTEGCQVIDYHRHCSRCGTAYFNINRYVIFCSVKCADEDREWKEASEREGGDGEE